MFKMAKKGIRLYSEKLARDYKRLLDKEQKEAIKNIYERERQPYADQVKNEFNILCHQGRIKKAEQKELRILLEKLLGGYVSEYKSMRFDNEFHRLYTYLRSYHLDRDDFTEINSYLGSLREKVLDRD